MRRIDANIVLRYLLDDHPELSPRAAEIIDSQMVVVSTEVLCEVVYVLAGVYEVPREEIRDTLQRFSRHPTTNMLEHRVICYALEAYAEKTIDFVDALLLAHHELHDDPIETFDRKLKKLLSRG